MKLRSSLFTKIILWMLLNLLILSIVLFGVFNIHFKLSPDSLLRNQSSKQLWTVRNLISYDLKHAEQNEWGTILNRYSELYEVDFMILNKNGDVIYGKVFKIPPRVKEEVLKLKYRRDFVKDSPSSKPLPEPRFKRGFSIRSTKPTLYWMGIDFHIPGVDKEAQRNFLIAASKSLSGNGLFFDPFPWIILIGVVVFLSIILWLPLARRITRQITEITKATEHIAKGKFDYKLNQNKNDEIGRLGKAINIMSSQIAGYIKGQKRFLGDVAHELTSPIARIQLGMAILENKLPGDSKSNLQDVTEDVRQLSELVNELLSFSKAEISPGQIKLQPVNIKEIVDRILDRETSKATEIISHIEPNLMVAAEPELLARALSNLLRNAIRYAGSDGPIEFITVEKEDKILIEIRDSGPGVPDSLLEQLFEPFFRPESARTRETGGVGLGLAIVKTCIQTCQGSVLAENLNPKGFKVQISLNKFS